MPRYCDACRTFITSRDSLTRNATPAFGHTRNTDRSLLPVCAADSGGEAARGCFMTFNDSERQGNLWGCCPNNTGSSRQFGGYWPIAPVHVVGAPGITPIRCGFASSAPCTKGRLSFEFISAASHLPLLLSSARSPSFFSSHFLISLLPYFLIFSAPSDSHRASTRLFVASSIRISSGHGRVKPSDAHLRVASTPIFEPKPCIPTA